MSRLGRILLIEDRKDWQETLSELLEIQGYHVEVASTFDGAVAALARTFYHLAIIDVRLVDWDETDTAGMVILERLKQVGLSDAIEKIMISAYGTIGLLREAFREYRVSDFILKEEFNQTEFLQTVRRVFDQRVRVNCDLTIVLEDGLSYEDLAMGIAIEGTRLKKRDEQFQRVIEELTDLFRRLFYQANSIVVRPVSGGHGRTGVVRVEPFYAGAHGEPVIVKYGDYREVDLEYKNYRTYVRGFMGGNRATSVLDLRRTPLLGGIIYSLIGAEVESIVDFAAFYEANPLQDIEVVLDNLFRVTCANWYTDRGSVQRCCLSEEYADFLRLSPEKIERALKDNFPYYQDQRVMTFRDLPGERFPNPVYAMAGWSYSSSTFLCVTHGDLNAGNIMIDEDRHTWLIDFYRTGKSHILRDCIELESVVKFSLLVGERLIDRFELERSLLRMDRFSQLGSLHYDAPDEEYAKSFAAVKKLRQLAGDLIYPHDDFREYGVGLFYYCLNMQRFYSLPKVNRLHALMAAGMLCDKLKLTASIGGRAQ